MTDAERLLAPEVASLFAACPALEAVLARDAGLGEDFDLPTLVFGATATLLIERGLPEAEEDRVFAYFNALAERGTPHDLDILGTGAIELFNDSPAAQRLARTKLRGAALRMLEEFRIHWGQPDYGGEQ